MGERKDKRRRERSPSPETSVSKGKRRKMKEASSSAKEEANVEERATAGKVLDDVKGKKKPKTRKLKEDASSSAKEQKVEVSGDVKEKKKRKKRKRREEEDDDDLDESSFTQKEIEEINTWRKHRKIIRAFKFQRPFKVLCERRFMTELLKNRLTPFKETLCKFLNCKDVELCTTRCVKLDLERGTRLEGFEVLNAASNLRIARCGHDIPVDPVNCVLDVVWRRNLRHFFIATGDKKLETQLLKGSPVPIIYHQQNRGMFLKPLSAFQGRMN